jgi:hypothetical protein
VKYAREEADARRLWSCLRPQLLAPIVYVNAEPIARALNAAGYNATPDMIVRRVPRGLHRVPREIDPLQRGQLVSMAMNEWGLRIGAESLYDEFNLPQPTDENDIAPGAPQQVTSGGKVVGSVEAATDGAEAPKEELTTSTSAPKSDDQDESSPAAPEEAPAPAPTETPSKDDDAPAAPPVKVDITPSDLGIIVTVNEARAGQGLPPLRTPAGAEDPDGKLTIAEFKAKHEATVATAAAAEQGDADDAASKEPAEEGDRKP